MRLPQSEKLAWLFVPFLFIMYPYVCSGISHLKEVTFRKNWNKNILTFHRFSIATSLHLLQINQHLAEFLPPPYVDRFWKWFNARNLFLYRQLSRFLIGNVSSEYFFRTIVTIRSYVACAACAFPSPTYSTVKASVVIHTYTFHVVDLCRGGPLL